MGLDVLKEIVEPVLGSIGHWTDGDRGTAGEYRHRDADGCACGRIQGGASDASAGVADPWRSMNLGCNGEWQMQERTPTLAPPGCRLADK